MNTTFYERFVYLCEQKGKKRTTVVREIGISSGNPAAWKEGRVPNMEIVQKLAGYFGVTPSYFFDEETKTAPGEEMSGDELLAFALYGMEYKSIPKEKLAEIRRYAEFIKDK